MNTNRLTLAAFTATLYVVYVAFAVGLAVLALDWVMMRVHRVREVRATLGALTKRVWRHRQ